MTGLGELRPQRRGPDAYVATLRLMISTRVGALLAAIGGAAWCGSYSGPLIDPRKLDVVLKDDWAQHTLGWLFFRHESLSLPVGALHSFLYPIGTTLGYMDAIPWLAIMLRPFSAWLPADFQYLGLWLILCSAALAYVGARIAALSTPHWEQQALAGTLSAMAPTLVDRIIHPALCGHVFILAAIALHLLPVHEPTTARRRLGASFALLALGSATHPYFAVMSLALVVALPSRFARQLGPAQAAALTCAMLVCVAAELTLLGYVGAGMDSAMWGFGAFSANLNTFWNSMGHSRLFPALPSAGLQYEGYCYLGAGSFWLMALVSSLLLLPRTRRRIASFPWRRLTWPLVAALALALFALATPIRWGEAELLHIEGYHQIEGLIQTFRSSGRFIWPLAYVLNSALLIAVLRALRWRRAAATGALLVALGLQLYDVDTTHAKQLVTPARLRLFAAPQWSLADDSFHHLALFPAEIQDACAGPRGYRAKTVTELAYLAYRHHWTFNSGYAARLRHKTPEYCDELAQQVRTGKLARDTIYLVWTKDLRHMRKVGATCGRLERLNVCVMPHEHPFARYLKAHRR